MKTRTLRQDEHTRITSAGIPFVPELLNDNRVVVVVETDAGDIVGAMTVFRATHFEGAWISPEHRTAGVVRGLLRAAKEAAVQQWSDSWVFADVVDDEVGRMVERLGGRSLPVTTYVMPVSGRRA